ncbi:hypothetical protein A0H81_00155 [Grifola frondosa]|uniref:Survival Motor Neuron Gemin2-binding domain-containing protein n=1 Tax=Grifola frondosa TaxID=5627 RepID=A0A1C7MQR3_GRIFR|nr:hypothetical protein A0H81_00155 [Grifola frondosa]
MIFCALLTFTMRPLVSYDDITAPQPPLQLPVTNSMNQPPSKRRKPNQKSGGGRQPQRVQHWDDPGNNVPAMNYNDSAPSTSNASAAAANEESYEEEYEEEESRELTHDEIWDDSALLDAWNSAMAEYEAFHGPGKKWKEEPVKKSPLWYNVPVSSTTESKSKAPAGPPIVSAQNGESGTEHGELDADSTPLNFNTYVPTHDPSLASTIPCYPSAAPTTSYDFTNYQGPMVSQDGVLARLVAMYWGGYWTAVYHCQRANAVPPIGSAEGSGEDELEKEVDGDDVVDETDDDMMPAQR